MRLCPRCGKPSGAHPPPSSCQFCGYVLETIEGHFAFAPELANQSEGFEASYFDRLSRLEPGNFWFEARNQLLIWALQRYFSSASWSTSVKKNRSAQMRQALRIPGGGIMITVPQHPFLRSKSDEYAHHVHRYRIGGLKTKVERAGFKVVRATSLVSLLLPLLLAVRLKQRSSGRFDPSADFQIPALANRVLSSVMSLERTILKAGLPFPAGGSLLLLAKSV